MFFIKNDEQTILEISQGDFVNGAADSFLIDLIYSPCND